MSTHSMSKREELPGCTVTVTVTVDARNPASRSITLYEAVNAALEQVDAQIIHGAQSPGAIHYSS